MEELLLIGGGRRGKPVRSRRFSSLLISSHLFSSLLLSSPLLSSLLLSSLLYSILPEFFDRAVPIFTPSPCVEDGVVSRFHVRAGRRDGVRGVRCTR